MDSEDSVQQYPPGKRFRSSLMMNVDDTALLVIDVQERLAPHIGDIESIVPNISKLMRSAQTLGLQVAVTEQYPKGLGATVSELASEASPLQAEKTMFSCRECQGLLDELGDRGIYKLLLTGIETHVCVAQTAMDLLADGFEVFVAVDAVGARKPVDHRIALRRMENCGVTLTTTEAAMFEWCETASHEKFKQISALVK